MVDVEKVVWEIWQTLRYKHGSLAARKKAATRLCAFAADVLRDAAKESRLSSTLPSTHHVAEFCEALAERYEKKK